MEIKQAFDRLATTGNEQQRCNECGEFRINTPGGWSVCPRGHGRLHPRVIHQPEVRWRMLQVPPCVALCPECESSLECDISSDGEVEVHCDAATREDDAWDEFDDWPESSHHYEENHWEPVRDKVTAWLLSETKEPQP